MEELFEEEEENVNTLPLLLSAQLQKSRSEVWWGRSPDGVSGDSHVLEETDSGLDHGQCLPGQGSAGPGQLKWATYVRCCALGRTR